LKDYSKPVVVVSVVKQKAAKANLAEELLAERDARTLELHNAEQSLREELNAINAHKVAKQHVVDELEKKLVDKSFEACLANQQKLDHAADVFRKRGAQNSDLQSANLDRLEISGMRLTARKILLLGIQIYSSGRIWNQKTRRLRLLRLR
jgi:hypothetical protein